MIRPFHQEDAQACSRIIRACLKEDSSYPPKLRQRLLSDETPQNVIRRAALYYLFVVEENDAVVGVAGLDLNEIRLMHVDPAFQRRGIGRLMLGHLKTMVPEALFPEIFVYSTLEAVGFYEACGFKIRGPFGFEFDGFVLQTMHMSLPLASSV